MFLCTQNSVKVYFIGITATPPMVLPPMGVVSLPLKAVETARVVGVNPRSSAPADTNFTLRLRVPEQQLKHSLPTGRGVPPGGRGRRRGGPDTSQGLGRGAVLRAVDAGAIRALPPQGILRGRPQVRGGGAVHGVQVSSLSHEGGCHLICSLRVLKSFLVAA